MRSCLRQFLLTLAIVGSASSASAQQRVGPVYPQKPGLEFHQRVPQSGYDPFHWNRHTGQWDYVPIPYDPEPPGANYNPFRFNWHSGRWDYVAFPMLSDYDAFARESEASTFVDTRLDPQHLAPRSVPAPQPAPRLSMITMPPPINPHLPRPTTQPTTAPATRPSRPALSKDDRLARLRSLGRWQFNYDRGRWIFVLPPD